MIHKKEFEDLSPEGRMENNDRRRDSNDSPRRGAGRDTGDRRAPRYDNNHFEESPRWSPRNSDSKHFSDRPKRDYGSYEDRARRDNRSEGEDKEYPSRSPRRGSVSNFGSRDDRPRRENSFGNRDDRPRRENSFGNRDDRPRRENSFGNRDDRPRRENSFGNRDDRPRRENSFGNRDDRPRRENSFGNRDDRPRRENSFGNRDDRPRRENSFGNRDDRPRRENSFGNRDDRPRRENSFGNRDDRPRRENSFGSRDDRPRRENSFGNRDDRPRRDSDNDFNERPSGSFRANSDRFTDRPNRGPRSFDRNTRGENQYKASRPPVKPKQKKEEGFMRINKFISNAGICSRREADTLISTGVIKINGEVCTTLGTLVGPNDRVQFGDQTLTGEKKVYILMNKPKDYVTTTDDPQERKTVMNLIHDACKERIYPVGRLDRNTTGVLLFTNDGDLAKRLTHPSHGARKIYHVTLDSPLSKNDLKSIGEGVELEDGFIEIDEAFYVNEEDRKEVGLQIHSGKNRVVRRIFEKFGYKVTKLDRVLFAELTKKELSRGAWRTLTEKEVAFLHTNVKR